MDKTKSGIYQASPIILEMADSLDPLLSPIFDVVEAANFTKVSERFFNQEWASHVGMGLLDPLERESHFLHFKSLPNNLPKPLALRYHGHQFRNYNPQLGDGRGFLFGQVVDGKTNRVLDLGTKGSGTTLYSRGGDGRLTLKGAVREALATEMLESLGVETSKTFSIFETTENLTRHDEPSPTRAAVLTRLSHGHIRFGTFQRLAFNQEHAVIPKLVKYCLAHYYPSAKLEAAILHGSSFAADAERSEEFANQSRNSVGVMQDRACAIVLLKEVMSRSAKLTAQWMLAGFVHGVLNTDNMNISGESFDYGPYRFLPTYLPEFTAAYFDQTGLYAYGRQPEAVFWNLQQLAAALHAGDESEELASKFGDLLNLFPQEFNSQSIYCFFERMGLKPEKEELSDRLMMAAFHFLSSSQIGFEQFFHDFYAQPRRREFSSSPAAQLYMGEEFAHLQETLALFEADSEALSRRGDSSSAAIFDSPHPVTVLIDEIEQIWDSIAKHDDWSLFEKKINDIRAMGRAYGRRE